MTLTITQFSPLTLFPRPSQAQISSSTPYSRKPSATVGECIAENLLINGPWLLFFSFLVENPLIRQGQGKPEDFSVGPLAPLYSFWPSVRMVDLPMCLYTTSPTRMYRKSGGQSWSPQKRPRMSRGGVQVQLYCFFNLGARWGWVVNATPRPLYSWE